MSERKGTRALEIWCKRLVKDCPNVQIENMTTSWRNGMAFCALVHHFRPDLIDMSKLYPENIFENNQLAFTIAEKHLGIPALLDPEDMVENEVPDRLSVLTYLSQFYQRLGHTVKTKHSESDIKLPSPEPTQSTAPIKFGKTGLDKCAACNQPVYLAQRLMVSHKLYHRRCFRCSKCSGHLNPKNFEIIDGSDFFCDSCKNEKTLSKILHNYDQIGMLAFSEDSSDKPDEPIEEPISLKHRASAQSILEKISMFENKVEKETNLDSKLASLSLNDNSSNKHNEISTCSVSTQYSILSSTSNTQNGKIDTDTNLEFKKEALNTDGGKINATEKLYKSNINQLNFLQTQLSPNDKSLDCDVDDKDVIVLKNKPKDCSGDNEKKCYVLTRSANIYDSDSVLNDDSNVTDDIRLAKSHNINSETESPLKEEFNKDNEISITVPPRKKKLLNSRDKGSDLNLIHAVKQDFENKTNDKEYPDELNPFSEDEDEDNKAQSLTPKKVSTNPFGSSDEEDDEVPPIKPPPAILGGQRTASPVKRLIHANPFWSDDEEPTTDEETQDSSKMYDSSIATSTPNLPSGTPRHKKRRAPPPPSIKVTETTHIVPATSTDDVASISSLSSYNSTVHFDQKSFGKLTPRMKKRLAPTPPDSLSTVSDVTGSMDKGVDIAGRSSTPDGGRRAKGPAPGLPLPERREVKLAISPDELQVQLELLETQQLGLERQGVLIEQMIRDKCEGDEAATVPQEEVEDLVIQLCELVNEKNDLFRKQTELMYIRRQQRLEQEQADIEHEIRVIQSRPAVNRCDADKAREEQLVSRLVEIVRMRDELVQQLDAERRRERQEDLAIATSIANKRAQRNSESNSSSIKSGESGMAATPKKNKVKDKMKKHLKKAKHTLHIHKKKDNGNKKDDKQEKENST